MKHSHTWAQLFYSELQYIKETSKSQIVCKLPETTKSFVYFQKAEMQFNSANHRIKHVFNSEKIEKTVVKYVWPLAVKLTINAFLPKNYFNILGKYLQLLLIGVGNSEVAQVPDHSIFRILNNFNILKYLWLHSVRHY